MDQFNNRVWNISMWRTAVIEVKAFHLTLLLTAVIVLSHFLSHGHDHQRLLQIALLSAFCCLFAINSFRQEHAFLIQSRALKWSLGCFLALGLISSLLAYSTRYALYETSSLLIVFMLSMAVAREISRDSVKYLPYVLKLCAYGCVLYAGNIALVYLAALCTGIQPGVLDFTPGFVNYRFFNHVQTIILPFLVLLVLLDQPNGRVRTPWLLLAGFWWALLIVTGARGSFVGLVAAGIMACIARRSRAYAYCRAMLFAVVIGVAIYGLFFVAIPIAFGMEPFGALVDLAQRTKMDPTSGRTELWVRAIALIAEHPWLGVGPLHFAHYGTLGQARHPHDWILQIGAEWGLPALFCMCAAIGLGMRNLLRTAKLISPQDTKQQAILTAWIFIAFAILVDGLVSGLLVMPVSQLSIALYIACATGWSISQQPARTIPAASGVTRLALALVVSASMLALVWGAWPGIKVVIGMQAAPRTEPGPDDRGYFFPRLWQDGYF